MRRLFVAMLAAFVVVLSGCGTTPEGKTYYASQGRKDVVNSEYDKLAGKLLNALQLGALGTTETYVSNVSEGVPSKCPPKGGLIGSSHTGPVQICAQDGKVAFIGTMTAGTLDPSAPGTGLRLYDLEAWKDKKGVVSGGYTPVNEYPVAPGAKGTADDIKNADQALIKAFNERSRKYLGS